ncbi:peptidase S16 [Shewanella mangrovi]|uniref:Peptidase S16 n=1 Tax=Shewanella mangrovi TaxID=1515746 RepID=A0A094JBS7_9GAMM|nr:LON peptidase substrate-binding domain-containing protein [Shewanella mangrovi]KFZ36707.1 peptidase S16 [Shewanella mangrovi]
MKLSSIPLFPLPVCLMPEGQTELRIFEPRYQRLVREASVNQYGFGLCLYQAETQSMPGAGCLADIVDFEQLEDGLLGIVIRGRQRFTLNRFIIEDDGLKRGDISLLNNWHAESVSPDEQHITQQLQTLHQQHSLYEHYAVERYQDIAWVCQRWLEILPIDIAAKHQLMLQEDHQMLLSLLKQLID